jgi:signal transduction histidine kinase
MPPVCLGLGDQVRELTAALDDLREKLAERTAELEKLLQEQREEATRVQAILSSLAEGVLLEDQNSQIIMMNAAAQDLLAVLAEQFQAMKPVREVEAASDARRFEIGDRIISVETSPVQMPDGRQGGKVLVLRDITAETEVDRLKDEFISQISHELRTPLTSIKGYSDLLLEAMGGPAGEDERPLLERINRHADTLEDVIADLLDYTQLEAGNLGLRFEQMSIKTVVRQVAQKWVERFEGKSIKFSTQIDDLVPQIVGDEVRLRRVLDNLVENAYNYTLDGGEVSVALRTRDDSVIVVVKDTGVGISTEDQAHLFSRFHRAGHEHALEVRGVGVDLYVAKAIVEGHGGEIWVESEPEKGSTFTFTVPLDASAREPKPPHEAIADLADLLR